MAGLKGRDSKPAATADCASHAPTPGNPIDWYSKGETRLVEIDGICVLVRYVDRKARRGRISIAVLEPNAAK